EEEVKRIDGGSVANYFASARKPIYAENPTRVVVAGRFGGDGQLTKLIQGLARAGYGLLTVYSLVSGQALFEYDYVLRFGGSGRLSAIEDELSNFKTARLVGAFEARG